MKFYLIGLLGALLAAHPPTQAQLYKWKDADGRIHYSNNAGDGSSGGQTEIKVPALIDASTPPRVAKDWREQEADSKKRRDRAAASAAAVAASAPRNIPYAPSRAPSDPRNVPYNTPYSAPGTVIASPIYNGRKQTDASATSPSIRYEDTGAGKCRLANAIIGNKSSRIDGKPTMQNDRDAAANDAMAFCR